MVAQVHIRRAGPKDTEAVIAGMNAVCAEDKYFYAEQYIPTPQWEAVLRCPDTVPDHLLLVAELEGQFVGAGRVFPGPWGPKDHHTAEIGLFVLKPFRNQGIGTRLLASMLDWARDTDYEKVTLSGLATNERAIHLFKKFGFVVEGVRRRQFKVGQEYVDELLMAKFLTE